MPIPLPVTEMQHETKQSNGCVECKAGPPSKTTDGGDEPSDRGMADGGEEPSDGETTDGGEEPSDRGITNGGGEPSDKRITDSGDEPSNEGAIDGGEDPPTSGDGTPALSTISEDRDGVVGCAGHKRKSPISPPNKPKTAHKFSRTSYRQACFNGVRATLPSALNVINASSLGKLVQLVTASRLILYHEGRVDPRKDECHYQIKH